jgi:hypothetical protein
VPTSTGSRGGAASGRRAAFGMTTIKVIDADNAIADLEQVVGFPLR